MRELLVGSWVRRLITRKSKRDEKLELAAHPPSLETGERGRAGNEVDVSCLHDEVSKESRKCEV